MAPVSAPRVGSPGQGADMFLHVQSARAGKIKGEVAITNFVDDIRIEGWNWSVATASAMGSVEAISRRAYSALTLYKRVDRSTTGLMSALVTNDRIKEAKLTMRRAGGSQEPYLVITLNEARITHVSHSTDAEGNTLETLNITFTQVQVDYTQQQGTGLRGGSTSFSDELPPPEQF